MGSDFFKEALMEDRIRQSAKEAQAQREADQAVFASSQRHVDALREEIQSLRKTNTGLRKSLDEAVRRISELSKPSALPMGLLKGDDEG